MILIRAGQVARGPLEDFAERASAQELGDEQVLEPDVRQQGQLLLHVAVADVVDGVALLDEAAASRQLPERGQVRHLGRRRRVRRSGLRFLRLERRLPTACRQSQHRNVASNFTNEIPQTRMPTRATMNTDMVEIQRPRMRSTLLAASSRTESLSLTGGERSLESLKPSLLYALSRNRYSWPLLKF